MIINLNFGVAHHPTLITHLCVQLSREYTLFFQIGCSHTNESIRSVMHGYF